jgi:hypothetical protein
VIIVGRKIVLREREKSCPFVAAKFVSEQLEIPEASTYLSARTWTGLLNAFASIAI